MAAIQARHNQFNTMAHPLNRPLFLRRVPGFGDQLVFRLSPTIHFTLSLLIAPRSDGMAVDANANLRAAGGDRAAPQTPVAWRGPRTGCTESEMVTHTNARNQYELLKRKSTCSQKK